MLEEYKSFLATLTKLSREEEEELWKQYKEQDLLEARQSLIEHYQPWFPGGHEIRPAGSGDPGSYPGRHGRAHGSGGTV